MMDERCRGCRCETCRWRAAGSNCYYNEYGANSSRCSRCALYASAEELTKMKIDSYACKGYEVRYNARQRASNARYMDGFCGTSRQSKEVAMGACADEGQY